YEKERNDLKGLVGAEGDAAGGGGAGVGNPKMNVPPGQGKPASGHIPMKAAWPERMGLVTPLFPMKQQGEDFQRAMKRFSQKDMLHDDRGDLPTPLGINVNRYEVVFELVNGKVQEKRVESSKRAILQLDPNSRQVKKDPELDKLLQMAYYDE